MKIHEIQFIRGWQGKQYGWFCTVDRTPAHTGPIGKGFCCLRIVAFHKARRDLRRKLRAARV